MSTEGALLLINAGATVDGRARASDKHVPTPLMVAAALPERAGGLDLVRLLVNRGRVVQVDRCNTPWKRLELGA
jgi:hypothetical protein